jgi:hypothetical protein
MNCLPVAAILDSSGCGSQVRPLCPTTRQLSFTATDGRASGGQQLVAIQWHVARYLPDKYAANGILLLGSGPFYLLLFIADAIFLPQRDYNQRN